MDYWTKNEEGENSFCTNWCVWKLIESNSGGVATSTVTAQSTYILRCDDWLIVKTHWNAQYGNYVCFKNILAIETLSKTRSGEIESRGRPILNLRNEKKKYASMRRLTDLKFLKRKRNTTFATWQQNILRIPAWFDVRENWHWFPI